MDTAEFAEQVARGGRGLSKAGIDMSTLVDPSPSGQDAPPRRMGQDRVAVACTARHHVRPPLPRTLARRLPLMAIVTEKSPEECPNGHPLKYPNVLVGWDGTRRIWMCRSCDAVIRG